MNWKEPEAKVYTFEDMLEEYGYIVYTNVGVSMMPLLRQRRDVIEIRKKGPERCKKYDVVLYKIGSKYILHRIIQVREKDYVIVGDHNIWREWGITDSQILGVMTRVIRNGKTITPENRLYQLYVHLWGDEAEQTRFDWNVPLESLGGRTSLQAAIDAYALHVTQESAQVKINRKWHYLSVEETGSVWPNTAFGLYQSLVGPDESHTDFLEHIE